MAKLKPWYDLGELREDPRENRSLDAAEFAIHDEARSDLKELGLNDNASLS